MKAKYSAYSATQALNNRSPRSLRPSGAGLQKAFYILLPVVFFVVVWLSAYGNRLPVWEAYVYVAMSVMAFVFYVVDKWKAANGKWRIPEATLHLLELLGGWPGAMLAQVLIRHKNAKLSFQVVFWIMVILNAAVYVLLLRLWNRG